MTGRKTRRHKETHGEEIIQLHLKRVEVKNEWHLRRDKREIEREIERRRKRGKSEELEKIVEEGKLWRR